MNDIVCITECSGGCGNWDEINDERILIWI